MKSMKVVRNACRGWVNVSFTYLFGNWNSLTLKIGNFLDGGRVCALIVDDEM